MKSFYVDLHIHIGRTWTGKAGKNHGAEIINVYKYH